MKAAFFNATPRDEEYMTRRIGERGIPIEPVFIPSALSLDSASAAADAPIVLVFVDSKVDAEVLAKLPELKLLATRSTGLDHIDLTAAKADGVTVCSVPSYGEHTVAEHAFGLLLAISKRIFEGYDQIREHGDFSVERLQGFDLKGKTIGIIGTGRIGRHAIAIAKGFGMDVIAYDAFPNEALAAEFGFRYLPLPELLTASDVVTIHVPYMPETHHLLNKDTIPMMKRGAVLINTSRGAIVETESLLYALKEGRLGGAGLDVLEEEGALKDEMGFVFSGTTDHHDLKAILANHVLIDMPNVVITPHAAFNTIEAVQRISETTLDNIEAFLKGAPINTA